MKQRKQAARLLAKYERGTCSTEELALLEGWKKSVSNSPEIFLRMRVFASIAKKKSVSTNLVILSVTGTVIFLTFCCLWTYWYQAPTAGPVYQTVSTKAGERILVRLKDGSKVWLSERSSLRYVLSTEQTTRNVYLSGSGYFEVKHDSQHPFIVHYRQFKTIVLGTSFFMHTLASGNKPVQTVRLVSGKVGITGPGRTLVTLTPNEAYTIDGDSMRLSKDLSTKFLTSFWRDGKAIQLKSKSFIEIVKLLEKVYDTKISIQRKSIQRLPFNASIYPLEPIEYVLDKLNKVYHTHYRIKPNSISIY